MIILKKFNIVLSGQALEIWNQFQTEKYSCIFIYGKSKTNI